jgi:adenine specific DNA methylase Mod
MINKKILLAAFVVVLFSSCKKNYECWCTNENGSYYAGEIEGTKRGAKKQCAKIAQVPTTCDIR